MQLSKVLASTAFANLPLSMTQPMMLAALVQTHVSLATMEQTPAMNAKPKTISMVQYAQHAQLAVMFAPAILNVLTAMMLETGY